ncbi:hypothetical protein LXL04_024512 [Taraxacum kok-saghyz]
MRATSLDCRNRNTTSSERRDSAALNSGVPSFCRYDFCPERPSPSSYPHSLPETWSRYLPISRRLPVRRWSRLETTASWSLFLKRGRNQRLRHARSLDISLSTVVCWVVGSQGEAIADKCKINFPVPVPNGELVTLIQSRFSTFGEISLCFLRMKCFSDMEDNTRSFKRPHNPTLQNTGNKRGKFSDQFSETHYRILCPSRKIGGVIGKGGAIIKTLREQSEQTQAKITIAAIPSLVQKKE